MELPRPRTDGKMSIEAAIENRRTVRSFTQEPLTIQELSQFLWAAQGITGDRGLKRAAPSAGALYPMDVYAVLGKNGMEGLSAGIYHYRPANHAIALVSEGDLRQAVATAALSQTWMAGAPLVLAITAEYGRATVKYGTRGVRYAMIEAGHIAQNVFLQAQALGLGAGIIGAFDDQALTRALKVPPSHEPLLLMPVGYKA